MGKKVFFWRPSLPKVIKRNYLYKKGIGNVTFQVFAKAQTTETSKKNSKSLNHQLLDIQRFKISAVCWAGVAFIRPLPLCGLLFKI